MNEYSYESSGTWKFLRILGSGGFGQVSLWYDPHTGQKVAIKKLFGKALEDMTVKSKVIERWCNEVEIMKKLDHANIVSTVQMPSELQVVEPFPFLAMEYCCKGDLRQVLNKTENCCGLREPEILNILRDISNGLAYLHSCKIIHRDIKPDNIVLQQKGKNTVYKLIDLGYAKVLDQSSLSKSFVGTIQYIAPELFLGKEYSSSVDYWSFGLTAHEIITGYRPFLHGFRPSDWMKQIQNKSRSVICVVECGNGDIAFRSEISRKNHLTRCFLDDIEKWLQLPLDWDGQSRGRDQKENRIVIFEHLADIMSKKIIKVFSLPTYDILSYEVTSATDISDLRSWLKKDTGLEEDQLLLLPNGRSLDMRGNIFKNIEIDNLDRWNVSVFLYSPGMMVKKNLTCEIENFVEESKKQTDENLSLRQLKRFCADSVYLLQYFEIRYRNFLQGVKIKITHTKQKALGIESFYGDLEDEWRRIENDSNFLLLSHKTDLENYIYYRKAGKLQSNFLVRKWIENIIKINSKISQLKNSFNKTKQRQSVSLAKMWCQNLEDHSNKDIICHTPLNGLVEKGQNLWENTKKLSALSSEIRITAESAVKIIDKSIEETNRFLDNQILKSLFTKIWETDQNLTKFVTHLTNIRKSMNVLKLMIQHIQTERQNEVWSMIADPHYLYNQSFDKKTSEVFEVSPREEKSSITNVSNFSLISRENAVSMIAQFSSNLQTAHSIINENNRLRYRIQEHQQMCNAMISEMSSLNWDFIGDA